MSKPILRSTLTAGLGLMDTLVPAHLAHKGVETLLSLGWVDEEDLLFIVYKNMPHQMVSESIRDMYLFLKANMNA